MTEQDEAAMDAQFEDTEADLAFYARGFPLADFEDTTERQNGEGK